MQNIIKIKNISYQRYEELLLKKESIKKDAEQYKIKYDEIFNVLNNDVYEARMECVKKREIVTYCQNALKSGMLIYRKNLDSFVDKAIKDYKNTINSILNIENKKKTDNFNHIKQIKAIYRQLARLVHPDMNSDLKDNKIIQDLWNRTCIAYNCSNLEELEELEVLTNKYLESINHKHIDIEIPDVDEKIFYLNREIEKMLHSNPYLYKYFITNEKSINTKKEELLKELEDYKRYSMELDKQIECFHIEETD